MATEAQILANRSNARKSTGPRTPEGKAVVAQNATKHGLCGHETVIAGEDVGEFEFYRERRLAELDPVGELESDLAERIVNLSWRLKRAERLQAVAFDSLYARQKHSPCERDDQKRDANGDSTFGRALVRDFADCRVLDRLLMYERRIEHSLYRTMAELKRHRILQEVGPGQMWELRRALASEEDRKEGIVRGRTTYEEATVGGSADAVTGSPRADETGADGGEPAGSVPVRAYPQREEEKITPDGVTTNGDGRDARATGMLRDPSCKTKPICPAPHDGQDPCDTALMADSPENGPIETKPISGAEVGGGLKFQVSSGDLSLRTSHFTLRTPGFASCTPGD